MMLVRDEAHWKQQLIPAFIEKCPTEFAPGQSFLCVERVIWGIPR